MFSSTNYAGVNRPLEFSLKAKKIVDSENKNSSTLSNINVIKEKLKTIQMYPVHKMDSSIKKHEEKV